MISTQAPTRRVLVVEDDDRVASELCRTLPPLCAVDVVKSGDAGLAALERERYDAVVSDVATPGLGALELLDAVHVLYPSIPFILLAPPGDHTTATEGGRRGAFDTMFDPSMVSSIVRRAVARPLEVRGATGAPVIGSAPAFVSALDAVERVAAADAPVLLVGETGTGKDLLAARIHERGPRRHRPFIVVNVGAITASLLDSELFGHVGGAFTGAMRTRRGLIVEADGGTLFLDEVADMPIELQGRLLRVLETGKVRAVGSDHERHVDVRFIAATPRPLASSVRERHFREDLYFRLNILSIHVPPLRERREDIPTLVDWFFERSRRQNPTSIVRSISEGARERLCAADWPGNVRQLASVIERAVVLGREPAIEADDLYGLSDAAAVNEGAEWTMDKPCTLRALTTRYTEWVLARTNGDKARAAAILGVDPSTLYRWKRRPL